MANTIKSNIDNKFKKIKLTLTTVATLALVQSYAYATGAAEEENPIRGQGFYSVDDSNVRSPVTYFQSPLELINNEVNSEMASAEKLSLVRWIQHAEILPVPPEKYNRKKHFAGWIRPDNNCQNIRAKVLIRDSKVSVSFTNPQNCVVASGEWDDPYTGQVFTSAKDIQIDHVVPLKHTYDMGGWQWTQQKRCLYENFVNNEFHLLSVNGPENMKKGAASPDAYMPPNQKFSCQYLQTWLMIKTIWDLPLNIEEGQSIGKLLKDNNCSLTALQVPTDFIKKQRLDIISQNPNCTKSEPESSM